ncbi:hypothetical protein SISNIDRAFT_492081 [Sistotremastrum niveocremeum HHB9708]|uniref:Uncharacterized protein n=1 Tax=Sistotremastrum niveocremeum HHB9708 TaxID=1314777 RepID=A0A164M335_9AGAM|nr:hypothetical protein SISNIDRAFT_492084 [Sistotremastrum niveocremeum HHB9708]KZS86306.1 hypothetical protein SISNIDRAFT_492081 [Sistotremastrum niveocremeum HHB9708]
MPRTDDFEVWIEVVGNRAEEYEERVNEINNEKERKTHITCFIPTVTGKNFSVATRDHRGGRNHKSIRPMSSGWYASQLETHPVSLRRDHNSSGSFATGSFMFSKLMKQDPPPIRVDGCRLNADTKCFFRFGTIQLSGMTVRFRKILCFSSLALIQKMHRLLIVTRKLCLNWRDQNSTALRDQCQTQSFATLPKALRPVREIHDRASTRRLTYKERDDHPKTEFTFPYTPKEWLKAKELIARSSRPDGDASQSPTHYTECDLLDDKDAEAFRQIMERAKNKKAQIVKVEPLVPPPGAVGSGEVIDLTDG